VRVELLTPADWRAWRKLRLEALLDTPIGYGELHADAVLRPDEEWQERMGRPGLRLMAYDSEGGEGGVPVGMAGGFHDESRPVLFGVYVRPGSRGGGVLGALVDVVEAWAAPDAVELDVHVANARAHAAYLKLGFAVTGHVTVGGGIDGRDLVRLRRGRRTPA
jgi:GNAT superfamily N-acetyltransferase